MEIQYISNYQKDAEDSKLHHIFEVDQLRNSFFQ